MKKVVSIMVILGAMTLFSAFATPAQAGHTITIDSEIFAEDPSFCGGGGFGVAGKLRVVGGVGVLPDDCTVFLSKKATIEFKEADISGGPTVDLIIQGVLRQRNVTKIKDSSIGVGSLSIAPSIAENNALADIRGSTLVSSGDLEILVSCGGGDGKATIKDSTLIADGDIFVGASGPPGIILGEIPCNGPRGRVDVRGTDFDAAQGSGDVLIGTSAKGRTKVKDSSFDAPDFVTIVTGFGGTCVASGNTGLDGLDVVCP